MEIRVARLPATGDVEVKHKGLGHPKSFAPLRRTSVEAAAGKNPVTVRADPLARAAVYE